MRKAEAHMQKPNMAKEVQKRIDAVMLGKIEMSANSNSGTKYNVEDAVFKFADVLINEVRTHIGSDYSKGNYSKLALELLENIYIGSPIKIGDHYEIGVWFAADDLHRESLDPESFPEGIDNIIALLNSGYDANGAITGTWVDHRGNKQEDTWSVRRRGGAHFIEQAISDFNGNYATDYNVTKIIPDDVYGIRTEEKQ